MGPQGAAGPQGVTGPQGATGAPGVADAPGRDGVTTWGTIDRPEWTDLISFSNIGPYMHPPEETSFDLVVRNSVTPNLNLT